MPNTPIVYGFAIASLILAFCTSGAASDHQAAGTTKPPQKSAPAPQAGTAKGTLVVGATKLPLTHAYAVARKDAGDAGKEG